MREHLTFDAVFQERTREVYRDMIIQTSLEQDEYTEAQLEKVQASLKAHINALRKLLDTIEREYLEVKQPTIANICTSAGDTAIDDWLARQEELGH